MRNCILGGIFIAMLINFFPFWIGFVESSRLNDGSYWRNTDLNKDCSPAKRLHYVIPGLSIGCRVGLYLNEEVK